jgi:3-hydroxyacyl-[acyl-carrier-protein] dehydratase
MNDISPLPPASVSPVLETLDILDIMRMLPHRYPLLMIDRVIDIHTGESATGIKNVSINEHYFAGHFPTKPVMPGVLIIEAMAQTAAVVVIHSMGGSAEGKLVYFMSIDEARFRKPVMPGDQLQLRVKKVQSRRNIWKFRGEGYVGDKLCAEAEFTAMIVDE